ncbi:F-box domain-containing protein [Mycena kentingensis (nom. inval.)]|nr:F-box domain-containing protein [Mycena kentingensis (nom. inval.)]
MGSNVRLASLREERSFIDASIALLRQRRAKLDEQIAAIPYPVVDIPADIAIAIFESAILSTFEKGDPILVRIAAVCGKWRNIALGTPTLWQRFSAHNGMADLGSLFCVFAQRSLDLPIYLHIRIAVESYSAWWIPSILVEHGNRWKEVSFTSGTLGLEALTVNINMSSANGPDMNAFSNAPLRRLSIGHPSLLGYYAISPSGLKILEFFGDIGEREMVQVLREVVNLEQLTLCRVARNIEADTVVGTEPILMTKLASLDTGAGILFDWITAPRLHTLRLPSYLDFAEVTRFMDRSSCALRSLVFSTMPSLQFLQGLLPASAMASVSSLSIDFDHEIEGDVAELISNTLGSSSLLPSLRSLEVIVSYPLAGQIWPFVQAVKKRAAFAEPTRRIEEFLLRFPYVDEMYRDVDVQDLMQLRREHGLRVEIPTGIARWERWRGK